MEHQFSNQGVCIHCGVNRAELEKTNWSCKRLQDRSTEELVSIWSENDRNVWGNEMFEAIAQILNKREIPLQPQQPVGRWCFHCDTPLFQSKDEICPFCNGPAPYIALQKTMRLER